MVDSLSVLVVDDDARIRSLIKRYLNGQGVLVAEAMDARNAQEILDKLTFDVMVLDVMMPGMTGLELTRTLRAGSSFETPILLLTARGEAHERINGLEAGADDYLTKPFEPKELLLRIQAIARRTQRLPNTAQTAGEVTIGKMIYYRRNGLLGSEDTSEETSLSDAEAKLLDVFLRHEGEILSREKLAKALSLSGNIRTVDVQVTRLRRKLEPSQTKPLYIRTVRGQGYVFSR